MKTNTQHTGGQESDTLSAARKAVESAISQLTTIKHEPQAADVQNGERLGWLLDDLLRARLELELLDDEPELQGGTAHRVESCPDCSKPLGSNRGCAYCVADALRSQTPEPQMATDAEPADTLREIIDLCNDEILDTVATSLNRLEDARRKVPDADPQPLLDQAIIEAHNAVTAAFGKLGRGLRGAVQAPRGGAPGAKTASGSVSERRPCDHRDADAYLAKGEEALAVCLEVDGQEFIDDESGALLSRSLTRAWSAVRMARLELRPSKGGEQ